MTGRAGIPQISVITATYNSSRTLRHTIASVLDQDFQDFEMLVIGDACTDDSAEVVESFGDGRVLWHNRETNSGSQSLPNNEGIRRARGRYLAFVGHDDLWLPWHLSSLRTPIEAGDADLIHSLCPLLGPEGVYELIGPPRTGSGYARHSVPPSSWLLRREVAERVGPWQDHRSLAEGVDVDFQRRVIRSGGRMGVLPEVTLLKFPSAAWRIYDPMADSPQAQHLAEIRRDATGVLRRVLTEVALLYSRDHSRQWTLPIAVTARELALASRRMFTSVKAAGLDLYGRERWPLSAALRTRFQGKWKRRRRQRGLSG